MRFEESVREIETKLNAGTVLASDATLLLLALLRSRQTNFAPDSRSPNSNVSIAESFYAEAEMTLSQELLGYEAVLWDPRSGYRRCNFRTAKIVDERVIYIGNELPSTSFHMMWGSRQVEAFLAEIMNLGAFESGDSDVLQAALAEVEDNNPLFHTETGIQNVWAIFTGAELARLYLQLKAAILSCCRMICDFVDAEQAAAATLSNSQIPVAGTLFA